MASSIFFWVWTKNKSSNAVSKVKTFFIKYKLNGIVWTFNEKFDHELKQFFSLKYKW